MKSMVRVVDIVVFPGTLVASKLRESLWKSHRQIFLGTAPEPIPPMGGGRGSGPKNYFFRNLKNFDHNLSETIVRS